MKKTHLFLLLPAFIAMGCARSDDPVRDIPPLLGTWNLVNVSGSITGASYDFEPGTIKWNFQDGGVIVINNNTDQNTEDIFESGTYSLHFEANEVTPEMCNESLFVDTIGLGCVTVSETQLVISQVEADGYQLTFVK